jgi:translation initiation factor 1 (eIF-1/SUI1)
LFSVVVEIEEECACEEMRERKKERVCVIVRRKKMKKFVVAVALFGALSLFVDKNIKNC